MSDPNAVKEALRAAVDAFNEEGHGVPTREPEIDTGGDWQTQLTKGCRLLAVVEEIEDGGYYTAVVELYFGVIERSLEAFAIAEGGDELRDFQTDFHDLRSGGAVRSLHAEADARPQRPVRGQPDGQLLRRPPSDEATGRNDASVSP